MLGPWPAYRVGRLAHRRRQDHCRAASPPPPVPPSPTTASMMSPAPASSSPGDLPWRARAPTRGDGAPAPLQQPRRRRRGMAGPSGGVQMAPRGCRARRMGGCYTIGGSGRAVALLLGKAERQRRLSPKPPNSEVLLPALPRPVTSCLRLQSVEMYAVSVRYDRPSLSWTLSLAGRSARTWQGFHAGGRGSLFIYENKENFWGSEIEGVI